MADVNPTAIADLYSHWKMAYGQKYGGPEDKYRLGVFTQNYEVIVDHNSKNSSYQLGLNQFAAITQEEFTAIYLGYHADKKAPVEKRSIEAFTLKAGAIPDSVDWVEQGKVTPVKNQGQCGSCWTFSTTGAIEGHLAIATGELVSLSEQQLVDCAGGKYENQGCNGGLMDNAFKYVIDNGIVSEQDYPYVAADKKCNIPASAKKYHITSYKDVNPNNAADFKAALATGPVSVAIEADTQAFQFYKSGVLTNDACGTNLDHGVLAVGYGTLDGTAFWKIKNSWGPTWGLQGYILLEAKDGQGECGVQEQPSYPVA